MTESRYMWLVVTLAVAFNLIRYVIRGMALGIATIAAVAVCLFIIVPQLFNRTEV